MILTSKELNLAYSKVNEIYKNNGRDTSLPVVVWIDDKEIQFKWDETVGNKGTWIVSSDFDIDYEDDLSPDKTEEELKDYYEDRDFDFHL